MLRAVLNEIGRRQSFVVTSHARPDGDAVGSTLACCEILRKMGKQCEVVLHDGVPGIYANLPFANQVLQAGSVNGKYEAAIILECDSVERTRVEGLRDHFLINIDHHLSAKPFANVNWIENDACATGEMIYRLAREADIVICPEIATCLYTAMLTDTGSFSFPGTDAHTFELAAELVRCGADPVAIAQRMYFSHKTEKMRLLGTALDHLQRSGPLVWMHVTRDDMQRAGAVDEDCEGLVNYALGIDGVEVAVFFRELANGRYRVSLRSKGSINVTRVAEKFGGGGHSCASGCSLPGPLEAATERILAELK